MILVPPDAVIVSNLRLPVREGYTPLYVGRRMPRMEGSVFGNPLQVVGTTWTREADEWTRFLMVHEQPAIRHLARCALKNRGYQQGEAATLYLEVLREQCRTDTPQRRRLLELSERVVRGERYALQCWCPAGLPCHASVVREALMGYAQRSIDDSAAHDRDFCAAQVG
ncbi:DUF4326 domain-containing protein [Deinococcus ruber]|uniref:DUF4326 domain-containing protein n=1 Tax=Deinococcus ruber TaxID=1848197 RepID=UPI00166978BD|nr:DUF4326 domain-containing protein [Deinococcus ruber]